MLFFLTIETTTQVIPSITPSLDEELNTILSKLGPAPNKVEREQDYSINLTMGESSHESSYAMKHNLGSETSQYKALREKLVLFLKTQSDLPDSDWTSVIGLLRQLKARVRNFIVFFGSIQQKKKKNRKVYLLIYCSD
jgi:hypothetical protein